MSQKLPRLKPDELLRALARDGWVQVRQRGSHVILEHPTKPGRLVIPVHRGKDIRPGLLSDTLKDAGLTPDDLRRLR